MSITQTPVPPYYAVIFTSQRTEGDQGYSSMAEKVLESLPVSKRALLGLKALEMELVWELRFLIGNHWRQSSIFAITPCMQRRKKKGATAGIVSLACGFAK